MSTSVSRQLSRPLLSSVLAMAERLPTMIGIYEIAELLNVNRQRVHELAKRTDFPEPALVLHMGRVWLKAEVIAWARAAGRIVDDDD